MNDSKNECIIYSHINAKVLILTLGSLMLSACNGIPAKSDKTILAEPKILINQPYNLLNNNSITSDKDHPSIAIQRWDSFYSDPKLKGLIKIALKNNKDLESSIVAIQEVKARYQISDSQTTPTLGLSAGMQRSANGIDKNPRNAYNVGLGMSSYELDLWGKIASLKEQALQSYLATTAAKDTVQISLISNIAQTYVNLSYAEAQYNLAKFTVESREHSLFITQKRFEAGIDPKTPSLQAAASLENAKVAMYDAETAIMKLQNALQILIGTPIPKNLYPKAGITAISDQKVLHAGLPSDLMHYRPDILQAEYNLKAAGANIDAARAAYFPSISLTGNLGVGSPELSDLFSSSNLAWSFGPSISVPIFDAGQLDANYKISTFQREKALVSYEQSIQNAFKEVSDVLIERATLEKRLASQYILQENFNETYTITNARFKSGLSNYLEVLEAERSKFMAQQSILQLEKENLMTQIQLYQVLGGGVAVDVPVEMSVANNRKLVKFISTNNKNVENKQTLSNSNIARGATTSKLVTEKEAKALKLKVKEGKSTTKPIDQSIKKIGKTLKKINSKLKKKTDSGSSTKSIKETQKKVSRNDESKTKNKVAVIGTKVNVKSSVKNNQIETKKTKIVAKPFKVKH